MFFYLLLSFAIGSLPFGELAKRFSKNKYLSFLKINKENKSSLLIYPFIIFLISFFDIAKIFLIISFSQNIFGNYLLSYLMALFAVLGDCYSPLLRFKGNRGVAVAFGFLLSTYPIAIPFLIALFFIILAFNKHPHISIVISFLVFPMGLIFLKANAQIILFFLLISFVVTSRHIDNIKNYYKGNETTLKEWFDQRNG